MGRISTHVRQVVEAGINVWKSFCVAISEGMFGIGPIVAAKSISSRYVVCVCFRYLAGSPERNWRKEGKIPS